MNIDEIKPLKKHLSPFCTCKMNATSFPWGRPEYSCNFTTSMDTCSKLQIKNKVYDAPCRKGTLRTERDTSHIRRQRRDVIELGDDNAPIMFPMDVTAGRSIPVSLYFLSNYICKFLNEQWLQLCTRKAL